MFIKKQFGIVEQIVFSSIPFLLLSTIAFISDEKNAVLFIELFSLSILTFLLSHALYIQPFVNVITTQARKVESEQPFALVTFLIFLTNSLIFLIYSNFSPQKHELFVVGAFTFSWVSFEAFRKFRIICKTSPPIFITSLLPLCLIIFSGFNIYSNINLSFTYVLITLTCIFIPPICYLAFTTFHIKGDSNKLFLYQIRLNGKLLAIGAVLFWLYTQGIYTLNIFNAQQTIELRLAQNSLSLVAVVMTYYENEYLKSQNSPYNFKNVNVVLLCFFSAATSIIYMSIFSTISNVVMTYILVFSLNNFFMAKVRIDTVELRLQNLANRIFKAHVGAALIFTLSVTLYYYFPSSFGFYSILTTPYILYFCIIKRFRNYEK